MRRTAVTVLHVALLTGATAAMAAAIAVPEGPVFREGILQGCQLMSSEQPYPSRLKKEKVTGQVVAELEIGKSGRAEKVTILSSTPPGAFDRAAMDWFRELRCQKGISVGTGTRFKFLLAFNLPDNLGDPIDATIDSWVVTGR